MEHDVLAAAAIKRRGQQSDGINKDVLNIIHRLHEEGENDLSYDTHGNWRTSDNRLVKKDHHFLSQGAHKRWARLCSCLLGRAIVSKPFRTVPQVRRGSDRRRRLCRESSSPREDGLPTPRAPSMENARLLTTHQ